jgi:catechol 2,3-dioxygenase-like lactoylglutathione lyase family enzyme
MSGLHAQTSAPRPHTLGFAHVASRVADLDKTQLFYESVLGYQEPFSLNDGTGKATTAFVKVNDLQYVELFQGDAQTQGQLDHFALYTDDLTAMRAHLQSLGMYIVKDTHKGRIGNPFLTIRDPDGHFIEILQYSANSLTGQSQGKFMPATRISDHITHVGIVVSAVDPALKFYRDALGFREISRGAGKNGEPAWIDLQAPDGSDYIELIPLFGKPSSVDLKTQNHFGLASAGVHNTLVTLEKRVPPSSPISSVAVQTGGGLPPRFNVLDPDGARIEIAHFAERGVGDHIYLMTSDVDNVSSALASTLPGIVGTAVEFVVLAIIATRLDAGLTGIFLLSLPAQLILEALHSRKLRPIQKTVQGISAQASDRIGQYVLGILTVRVFGRDRHEAASVVRHN